MFILSKPVFSPDSESGLEKFTRPTGTPGGSTNFENRVGEYFHITHFEANDVLIPKTFISYRFDDVGENLEHFKFFWCILAILGDIFVYFGNAWTKSDF